MTDGGLRAAIGQPGYRPLLITLAVVVAWLGLWAHELYRVPMQLGLTMDGSVPLLAIAVALLVWWLRATHVTQKRAVVWALVVYGLINGVGGFLSVLPLPFLPFVPEQTVDHYLIHVLYAVSQAPLVILALVAGKSSVTGPAPVSQADAGE